MLEGKIIKIIGVKKFLPFFVIISMLFLMVYPSPVFAEGEGPIEEPAQGETVAEDPSAEDPPSDEVAIEPIAIPVNLDRCF